jgi:D-3-phosphoglycerate dehydrogenase
MVVIQKVLISDDIDEICPKLLRENGIEVYSNSKMTKDQLIKEIENYDALIVRSATKVTKEVIIAGNHLKLIGRAGTGVDNIDLEEATRKGVVVMNTPMGNSRSAAELTCGMIMSLSRRIPQADMSMKNGKWDRKTFMGSEVYGKTLAIIGLGRIGREVAIRMQAFGMTTIGFDPVITADQSKSFNVEWMSLDSLWPKADYITIHVPFLPEITENLINEKTLEKCKKGVQIINCARGGIVNEKDLIKSLDSGHCGGAALDVYLEEPPTNFELTKHPKVICTPHLGANTVEAQKRVAQEIAEQIIMLSRKESLLGAVNGQALVSTLDKSWSHFISVAQDAAVVLSNLCASEGAKINSLSIDTPADCPKSLELSLMAATLVGFLKRDSTNGLNLVNAHCLANAAGIKIISKSGSKQDLMTVTAMKDGVEIHSVSAYHSPMGTMMAAIDHRALGSGILLKGVVVAHKVKNGNWNEIFSKLSSKMFSIARQTGDAEPFYNVYTMGQLDKNEIKTINSDGAIINFDEIH